MTKISVKDVTQIGIMSAVLIAGKAALSFLPNCNSAYNCLYIVFWEKSIFFNIYFHNFGLCSMGI